MIPFKEFSSSGFKKTVAKTMPVQINADFFPGLPKTNPKLRQVSAAEFRLKFYISGESKRNYNMINCTK